MRTEYGTKDGATQPVACNEGVADTDRFPRGPLDELMSVLDPVPRAIVLERLLAVIEGELADDEELPLPHVYRYWVLQSRQY